MKVSRKVIEVAGWLPAVIFPLATMKQVQFVFSGAEGVAGTDIWPWVMFGVANFSLYLYSEKYLRPQAIIGFLGTGILDFVIVGKVLLS